MSRWPGELLSTPGVVRAQAAPSPTDVYWPNLLKPLWRLRANYWLGLVLTWTLFLFWTVPVAAVQAFSSITSLATIPGFEWLVDIVQNAGPDAIATFEGLVSSTILQLFLFLTLYSGLFPWLNRLMGAMSHTEISRMTVERMCLFEILLILLASTIASSVFTSLTALIEDPLSLPSLLAQNLPGQSTFFLHYLLNSILYVSLFDITQFIQLFFLSVRCCCPGKGRSVSDPPPPYSEADRLLRVQIIYARNVLNIGIVLTYFCIAPLTPYIAIIAFVPAYWLYAYLMHAIDGAPDVDTGGACWEAAMLYEVLTLLIAQLLLFGVLVIKKSAIGAAFAFIALFYTAVRSYYLRHRYLGEAADISLQRSLEIESESKTYDSLHPYATAKAAAPQLEVVPDASTAAESSAAES